MNAPDKKRPKILLHACCGPCSLEPVRLLRERGLEPALMFANNNIHPKDEWQRRWDTLTSWTKTQNLIVMHGPYNPKMWFQAASGFGYENKKERCRTCYRLRFEETAMVAKTAGIPLIGTTLSVSPYQDAKMIEVELENAAARYDLQPFFEDYSPYYERATERSRELGMYRQNYCGCCFSKKEAEREREQRKTERHEQAEAYRREHADEIAEEQRRLEERREQKREYEEKQARKHEILRNLRMQNRRSDPD